MKFRAIVSAVVCAAAASVFSGPIVHGSAPDQSPTVSAPRDLGTLHRSSSASAVSENGIVIGMTDMPGGQFVAFAWSEATGMVPLWLGGTQSRAMDINDAGMVVGSSQLPGNSTTHAFVWTPGGGLLDIGTLGGSYAEAQAVNNAGVVVGTSNVAGNAEQHVFLWTAASGMVDLGTLGGSVGYATAISDAGHVVGASSLVRTPGFSEPQHPFLWTAATGMVDLGTLGGNSGLASDVNDAGTVVGWSWLPGFAAEHAFAWTATTGMIDIGPPTGNSYARRISAAGIVTGHLSQRYPTFPFQRQQGFVWSPATGAQTLTLGGSQSAVTAVNHAGQVAGYAFLPGDSASHGVIWSEMTGLLDLGRPSGVASSSAADINNLGAAGGTDMALAGNQLPFVWTPTEGRIPLGTFAGRGASVAALNDAGLVVGTSWLLDNSSRATLWTITAPNTSPTPVGTGIVAAPTAVLPDGSTAPVSIAFDTVTSGGTTTVETSSAGPPPAAGFKLGQPPIYYDVSTTATFSGSVTLCFTWQEGELRNEANARLLHHGTGGWVDITTTVDTSLNRICGTTTSLSPFVIAEKAYTFEGFEAPLLSDGSATIQQSKAGRTIPVKIRLSWNGAAAADASATIAVYKILNAASGTVDTTDLTSDAGASNDSGNAFRFVAGEGRHVFNLSTRGWPAPATYRIVVTVSDGSIYSVDFSLR